MGRRRLRRERDRYREQFERERDRRHTERFSAQEEALRMWRRALKREFSGVNELRGQLNDVIDTKAEKGETSIRIDAVEKKVDERFGTLDKKVDELIHTVTASAGRSSGFTAGWGFLVTAITATATVVSIVVLLITRGAK